MKPTRRSLALVLFAGASGLAWGACSKTSPTPDGTPSPATTAAAPDVEDTAEDSQVEAPITTELALRDDMRRLWRDHASWTRFYIIAAVAGLEDSSAALARLLENQLDLGDAIRPYFGEAAGDALAALLRDHITIAAEAVTAARASDTTLGDAVKTRWEANADQIAALLAKANPSWWRQDDLKSTLRLHLHHTLAQAQGRLAGEWAADVTAYDGIVQHSLELADTLSDGIARRFPDKVAATTGLTAKGSELHRALRTLWQDQVTWTRLFVISAIGGLPDLTAVTDRLMHNQVALGDAIAPFYGAAAGDRLTALLRDHVTLTAEVVVTAKADVPERLADARLRWVANADLIAGFFAGLNPNWTRSEFEVMLRLHLEQTIGEASARLTRDWVADIAAYDFVVGHSLKMADALSAGIAKQFPERL